METILEHLIESEIAGLPPRRARLPGRLLLLLAVAYLLLGLFLLGSGRAIWEAGKLGWIVYAGRTLPASVVEIQTEPALVKGKPPMQVAIRYRVSVPTSREREQSVRTGWIGLGQAGTRRYHPGQILPYRYARWFGRIVGMPWQPAPAGRLTSLVLSGGLVALVSGFLIRRLTRWVQAHLNLLREGIVAVGTITHKRAEAEDIVRYYLCYGYATALGERQEREEQVSQEWWKQFEVGQPVTVLYDPVRPEHAGLYALMRH